MVSHPDLPGGGSFFRNDGCVEPVLYVLGHTIVGGIISRNDDVLKPWLPERLAYLKKAGVGDTLQIISRMHPALVPLVGINSGLEYTYMSSAIRSYQYVTECPLMSHPKEDQIFFVDAVCSGLSFLHLHNLIQRDVTPSNILLVWNEEFGCLLPMIFDYELVMRIGDTFDVGLGADGWVPTEMRCCDGSVEASITMDTAGIGLVIGALYVWNHLQFKRSDIPKSPDDFQKDVCAALREYAPLLAMVVSRAIDLVPALRYQTVGELRDDFVCAIQNSEEEPGNITFPSGLRMDQSPSGTKEF